VSSPSPRRAQKYPHDGIASQENLVEHKSQARDNQINHKGNDGFNRATSYTAHQSPHHHSGIHGYLRKTHVDTQ